MKYGIDIPNFGYWADPRHVAEFARQIEDAGWDGLSIWDHLLVWQGNEVGDPWIALAGAAAATDRISLMMLVTPLPRRRPWKVAREAVSLDQLSGGRFVLGVGIGYPPEEEFATFGEPTDDRLRADMLDEGLDIVTGLWSGDPFSYDGEHYQLAEVTFAPGPVQQPRIPIWVAGMWPNRRPFRRAARYDGVAPIILRDGQFEDITPESLTEMLTYVNEHRRDDTPFDVTVPGSVLADPARARDTIAALQEAGMTWWREGWNPDGTVSVEDWHARVLQGPPV
ncbi:MAG: LLM class flavin-dependent oxidoreductase [Acidimicrobiia bacterium]|nr:LLM class flavin-dependent oxidoreductase [Acidimicrobiia bacterium]